jgi:hypothetical protein
MRAAAVIVGIDDYEVDPLTGACADACNFRDALLRLPGREYDEPSPLLRYAGSGTRARTTPSSASPDASHRRSHGRSRSPARTHGWQIWWRPERR